jgi:hypothetical protein
VYKRAALGTVRMNAMRGPAGSPQTLLELQPQARTCQGDLWTNVEQDVTPLSRTVHVSPGSWSVRADTFADENGQSDDIGSYNTVLAVKAGKSYLRTFYRSAWGPANYGPYVAGKSVWFDTSEMFTDPAESNEFGGEGSEKSTVTLTLKKKVLVTRTRTDWGGTAATFSYRLKSAGWYTLSVNARRYRPGYHYPADMLSPQSSVVFHFHADPRKQGNVPVYLTRFVPAGVSNTNSVKPGTTTAVTLKLQRPIWSNDLGHPAVKMKTLTAWASSDNGKTWHVATVRRSGNNWVALVRSPASGTISLRARVTDPTGVSCETTVYRAYAVQ